MLFACGAVFGAGVGLSLAARYRRQRDDERAKVAAMWAASAAALARASRRAG